MSLFETNIEFMKKNTPELYDRYKNNKVSGLEKDNEKKIELDQTSDYLNIRINNKLIHSRYNPMAEGQLISMALENQDYDTIFIFGLGLGYHLEAILNDYPDKNKIIYEPNYEVFEHFIHHFNMEEIYKKNVMLIIDHTKENVLKNICDTFMNYKIYKLTFIGLPSYITEYAEAWSFITKEFINFFSRYSVNVKTLRLYNEQWMMNFFRNLKHYPFESEISDYIDQFKNIPAVIVSSGPSLTKNMHLLNQIKEKALILSAGSSVNALQNNNITPHIMLGVDGSQLMSDEYNAVKDNTILFSHIMNIHPDCIDQYKGPKMHIRVSSEPHLEYFEKINNIKTKMLRTGGSCANVALDFLVSLGCNPIIFIGQDLAFPGNVTHAEGVWDRVEIDVEDAKKKEKGLFLIKDAEGNDVYTNRIFDSFRRWFEEYIEEKDKEGLRLNIINATEGGAFIQGATHMKFSEAIDQYCKEDRGISEKLKNIYDTSLEKSQLNKEYVNKFIEQSEKDISRLEKMSKQRLKLIEKLRNSLKKKNANTADMRKKINRITEKLEADEAYLYFIWQSIHDILYNIKNHYEDKAKKEKDTHNKLELLYEGLATQFNQVHFRLLVVKKCMEELKEDIKRWNE